MKREFTCIVCPNGCRLHTEVENGAVTGVVGKAEDGTYKKFSAAKGVILATGDFQNNDAMLAKYVPDALVFNRKQINKTGDGHLIGLLAGAVMEPGGHSKMIHGGKGCFRFLGSVIAAVHLIELTDIRSLLE